MTIQIQRRARVPATAAEWFARLAPQGLNTNTQFFLVFLGVLALHLVLAPVFKKAAAFPEPGEPQRYLTSQGAPAQTTAQKTQTPSAAERDRLILADTGENGTGGKAATAGAPTPSNTAPPANAARTVAKPIDPPKIPVAAPVGPQIADLVPEGAASASDAKAPPSRPLPQAQPISPTPGEPAAEAPAGVRQFRTLP